MQRLLTAENGLKKIMSYFDKKSVWKYSSIQKEFDTDGNVYAEFRVYTNGQFEVVLNTIDNLILLRSQGKSVFPMNRTLCEHPDAFIALINEFESISKPNNNG